MKIILTAVTVLLLHTAAAYGQQSYPQQYPPGYGPPPGYAPPPVYAHPTPPPPPPPAPYYYYPPPPPPPPPPRPLTYRPLTLGLGIGFGGLTGESAATGDRIQLGGFAYTFRLGVGLAPRLILMWDIEGAVGARGDGGPQDVVYNQTAHLAALQLFLGNRLFLKGGLGAARLSTQNDAESWTSAWGGAAMIGIGYELIQSYNWSFAIEATATGAHYPELEPGEWTNWSLVNFVINFY